MRTRSTSSWSHGRVHRHGLDDRERQRPTGGRNVWDNQRVRFDYLRDNMKFGSMSWSSANSTTR